jgi:hypothetical protein
VEPPTAPAARAGAGIEQSSATGSSRVEVERAGRTGSAATRDDTSARDAQYIHDEFGKFPGTLTTLVLTGFAQAHHIDTDYYDTHFGPGAYLDTHADHMRRWHGAG